jgi:transglutaminase-like putative cysteine protease
MRYLVSHRTTYTYDHEIAVALHVARLRPRETEYQRCVSHQLQIEPQPAALRERIDYFGNTAHFLTVEGGHRSLSILATSEVEILPRPVFNLSITLPWEQVRDRCAGDLYNHDTAAAEYAFDSQHVRRRPEFADYASLSFTPGRPVLEAMADLNRRIYQEFIFDSRATTVTTPAEEVLVQRRGVCQDFAHLAIACLRSLGLPARYVSGYLETLPPPGQAKLAGADASHAWISIWCPDLGWVDFDPTNNLMPVQQYLVVGWGLDFADVSPVRGILIGTGTHQLDVAVDMFPLERDKKAGII